MTAQEFKIQLNAPDEIYITYGMRVMKQTYVVVWININSMAFKLSVGGQTLPNDFKSLDEVAFAVEQITKQP